MNSSPRSKPLVVLGECGLRLGRRATRPATSTKPAVRRAATRSAVATLALTAIAALGLLSAVSARASDPFPVQETFRGATFGSQWRHGGSAELTGGAEAEGWLRLTSAAGGEFGYAYDDEAFPSTDGALVEFEYADWGGSGADGLTFFLFNGSTSEAEFHAGQPGGALGYASCNSATNGLTNAYVGVGFDEYGNFTNLGSICGLDGTEFMPNHVSIRGSAAESYKLLATAPTTESLRAERSQARRVTIAITPDGKLSVYIRYPDGTFQAVTEDFQLPAAPEKLKFGYVASTGSLTDYHEIRNAQVVKPTQLTPAVTQTAGGHQRGEEHTWTAVVRNEGPNPTQREQVRATTGAQSLANVSWTCEAAGGAECVTAAGSGLPSPEAGAMPQGSSLTYKITGTPAPSTDYAQMTIASEPRGDTGELDPEMEQATATTDLTPLFEEQPSFTLAADGEADATAVAALGGEISYSYTWQRCEADGESCTNIPGAEATTYRTTSADLAHTIRFVETATNSAGSAAVDSAVYEALPTVEITSAPAPYVTSSEAVLSFVASTDEATLECSLDGAAWSECSSPIAYGGLAEGAHTFRVRAVYGGLSDSDPASAQWTIGTADPASPSGSASPPPPGAGSQSSSGSTLPVPAVTTAVVVARTTTRTRHRLAAHARRVKRPRNAARHKRTATQHRHPDRARGKATKGRHAAKRLSRRSAKPHRSTKTRRSARRPRPKVKTRRRAAKREGANHNGGTPTNKTPGAATTPQPQAKGSPRAHARKSPSKRSSPAVAQDNPGVSAPAGGGKQTSTEKSPRRDVKHTRQVKASPRTATPTPTSLSETGRKPKRKQPAPAAATTPRGKTPAPAAATTPKGKTPASATKPRAGGETHTPKRPHKDRARREAGRAAGKLVIRPFRPQSSTLVARARRLLKHVAAEMTHVRLVVCVGFTDDLGERSANLALGLQRARAVCAKLRALGVHAVFKAETRGEGEPCASNATAAGRARNRRVELRISY